MGLIVKILRQLFYPQLVVAVVVVRVTEQAVQTTYHGQSSVLVRALADTLQIELEVLTGSLVRTEQCPMRCFLKSTECFARLLQYRSIERFIFQLQDVLLFSFLRDSLVIQAYVLLTSPNPPLQVKRQISISQPRAHWNSEGSHNRISQRPTSTLNQSN